jgi:hypothetical protein
LIRIPHVKLACACVVALVAFSANALADGSHDRTQMGHSISIGPDEQVNDATCFGCSIRVRGHVDGDVTSFGGSIIIEDGANIGGDATDFGGDIRLDKDVKVSGDVADFGGRIRRDPGASIGGDVTDFNSSLWIFLIFVLPLFVLGGFIALIIWAIRRLMRSSALSAA